MRSVKRTAIALIAAIAACAAVFCGIITAGENPPAPPEGAPTPPAKSLPAVKVTWKATELGIRYRPSYRPFFEPVVSPDGRRYASTDCGETIYDPQSVIIDGAAEKEFSELTHVVFSPDSKHVAYAGTTKDGKTVLVVDGKGTPVDGAVDMIIYSPDSKRMAYFVTAGEKHYVVVDGKKEKEYIYAFSRTDDLLWSNEALVDVIRPWQEIPFFSPDSQHYAYIALSNAGWTMVVDGVEGKKHGNVSYFAGLKNEVFSPDSKHVSYQVIVGDNSFIVLDGKEIEGGIYKPAFSPDGKRVAYALKKGEKAFVVSADGKPGKEYTAVTQPVFSPDSGHLAYVASRDKECFLVIDGAEGKAYKDSQTWPPRTTVIYSSDSQHIAFTLTNGGKMMLVVDAAEYMIDGLCQPQNIFFSSDSKHSACLVVSLVVWGRGVDRYYVMIDGVKSEEYFASTVRTGLESRCLPVFSPDSKHVAYCALKEKKGGPAVNILVVDNKEYEIGFTACCNPIFDSPTKFHFIGTKGDKVFLVEAEISE